MTKIRYPIYESGRICYDRSRPEEAVMATYELTKRPVKVTAVPFNGHNYTEVQAFTGSKNFIPVYPTNRSRRADVVAEVYNSQYAEWVSVRAGQWIIRGVVGELYPVDVDVLRGGYEEPEGGWPS